MGDLVELKMAYINQYQIQTCHRKLEGQLPREAYCRLGASLIGLG